MFKTFVFEQVQQLANLLQYYYVKHGQNFSTDASSVKMWLWYHCFWDVMEKKPSQIFVNLRVSDNTVLWPQNHFCVAKTNIAQNSHGATTNFKTFAVNI